MKHQLTQIRPLPVVAGDGKLPLPLADTGLPLYIHAMDAIDLLEEGIRRKDRKIIRDAQASLTGTMRLIQTSLCYEYYPVTRDCDVPDLWSANCQSGNPIPISATTAITRPYEHSFCEDCVFFNTDNNPRFSDAESRALKTARKEAVA